MKNFTEIVNIAGQRHNAKMFETDTERQSGAVIPLRLDTVIFDPCRRKYNISYEIEITPDTII